MLQAVRNVLMLPGLLIHLNVLISRELDCGGLFHRYCSAVGSEPSASQRGFPSLLSINVHTAYLADIRRHCDRYLHVRVELHPMFILESRLRHFPSRRALHMVVTTFPPKACSQQ